MNLLPVTFACLYLTFKIFNIFLFVIVALIISIVGLVLNLSCDHIIYCYLGSVWIDHDIPQRPSKPNKDGPKVEDPLTTCNREKCKLPACR